MGKRAKYILQLHIRDTLNIDYISLFSHGKRAQNILQLHIRDTLNIDAIILFIHGQQGQIHVATIYQRHSKYRLY